MFVCLFLITIVESRNLVSGIPQKLSLGVTSSKGEQLAYFLICEDLASIDNLCNVLD